MDAPFWPVRGGLLTICLSLAIAAGAASSFLAGSLPVDVSSSMKSAERALQRENHAPAFRAHLMMTAAGDEDLSGIRGHKP